MYNYYLENNNKDKPVPLVKGLLPNGLNAPIVLIIGWSGAKIKPLLKYCDIYVENGFNCFILCTPIDPTTLLFHKHVQVMLDGLELYIKRNPNTPFIITHSFSVGGIMTGGFFKMINTMKRYEHMIPYFAGVVMDSGPAATIKGALHGYYYSMKSTSILLVPLSIFAIFLIPIYMHAYRYYYPHLINPKKKMYNLVLYSNKDTVLYDSVDKFIKDLKDNNDPEYVKDVDFIDSDHCTHLLKYKEKYNNNIQELINKIKTNINNNINNIISKL